MGAIVHENVHENVHGNVHGNVYENVYENVRANVTRPTSNRYFVRTARAWPSTTV
ncbi:MAG: hypothetical protein K8T90_12235 [Planctomycetes bacterium]|nr:hypothetical protein [Planctomycetota bacterium]